MNGRGHAMLAAGLVMAAAVLGWSFYAARAEQNSLRVVGTASKRITADVIKWRLTLARTASDAQVSDGFRRLHADVESTIAKLTSRGIAREKITVQSINSFPMYGPGGQVVGRNMSQSMLVISEKVGDLEPLTADPASILPEGAILENASVEYFHSDLAAAKRELMAAAMTDAQHRADALAGAADVHVGHLLNSSVGVFQITEPYSTEVSDYGIYNTSTREKDISVTVRASFVIE